MGITHTSLERINRYLKPQDHILILGCQNLYDSENYGEIAHLYFEANGYTVRSLDILGCQCSEALDLRNDLKFSPVYNTILQHGTVEHVDGSLYQPFKNIHNACKAVGVMIHENPARDNWPGHGYHYFHLLFYTELAEACGYEILELTEEFAMGNTVDGKNISTVLKKTNDNDFISEEIFNEIYAKHICSK